jgi:peptidoglycan/xylan/chitin deacetylase (PgdA/CDA1 family)
MTENRQAAVFSISIDDGHPLDRRMAEIVQRHALRATFYVPGRNCEGPPVMSPSDLRALAQQCEIGSHTLEHRFLQRLNALEALAQINDGKAALQDALGQPVQGFCYPGGKYRPLHCQMVQTAGFDYARTTQNLRLDAGQLSYALPTTLQFYPHPASVLLRNFFSQRNWRQRREALGVISQNADWLERIYLLFDHVSKRGGVFHLWCHSLDLERLGLWHTLDAFLAYVSQTTLPAQRLDNAQLHARYLDRRAPPYLLR